VTIQVPVELALREGEFHVQPDAVPFVTPEIEIDPEPDPPRMEFTLSEDCVYG
jgi:hypothetical protein